MGLKNIEPVYVMNVLLIVISYGIAMASSKPLGRAFQSAEQIVQNKANGHQ